MTAHTLVGRVVDRDGLTLHTSIGWDGRTATMNHRFEAFSASDYRTVQPTSIPVNFGHEGPATGGVVHLEETGGAIVAVAVVEGPASLELLKPSTGPRFWSAEFNHLGGSDIELTGLGIVEHPAAIGLRPLTVHLGDIRDRIWRQSWMNRAPGRDILKRAAETHDRRRYHRGEPLRIEGHTQASEPVPGWVRRMDARSVKPPSGQRMRLPTGEVVPLEYTAPHFGGILSVR